MKHMEERKWILELAHRLGDKAEELFDEARDKEASAVKLSVLCIVLPNDALLEMYEKLKDLPLDEITGIVHEDEDDDGGIDELDTSWAITSQGGDS